jgi:hypothetical protein
MSNIMQTVAAGVLERAKPGMIPENLLYSDAMTEAEAILDKLFWQETLEQQPIAPLITALRRKLLPTTINDIRETILCTQEIGDHKGAVQLEFLLNYYLEAHKHLEKVLP